MNDMNEDLRRQVVEGALRLRRTGQEFAEAHDELLAAVERFNATKKAYHDAYWELGDLVEDFGDLFADFPTPSDETYEAPYEHVFEEDVAAEAAAEVGSRLPDLILDYVRDTEWEGDDDPNDEKSVLIAFAEELRKDGCADGKATSRRRARRKRA